MGSSSEFLELFTAEPGAAGGVPFARFMELALYHPRVGYYARDRPRVGRAAGTDFFTASSLGPVFGELVVAATVGLLGGADPGACAFIEVGAEPAQADGSGGGILRGVAHPFGAATVVRRGDAWRPPARAVVFSNELFDAQPCHRLVGRGGAWRETGVAVRDGTLVEVELPGWSPEVAAHAAVLPEVAPEGWRLDLPLRSVALLHELAAPGWSGVWLAFDYGHRWREFCAELPQGSARAYRQHRQSNELLAHPGEQDLTCHVCWDWLAAGLERQGFAASVVEAQEAFFARRAGPALAGIMAAEAGGFSPRKQALMQLLHPGQLGQKFQVLHARR